MKERNQNGIAGIASNIMNTLMGFRHNQVSETLMQTLVIKLGKEYGKGNSDPAYLISVAVNCVLEISNHEPQIEMEVYKAEVERCPEIIVWGDHLVHPSPNQKQLIEMMPG